MSRVLLAVLLCHLSLLMFFTVMQEDVFSSVCVCSPVQNQSDHVFFTVTEKEDVLGQVQMPVTSLTTTKGQVFKTTLKAHRKCPVPQGELMFQVGLGKNHSCVEIGSVHSMPTENALFPTENSCLR